MLWIQLILGYNLYNCANSQRNSEHLITFTVRDIAESIFKLIKTNDFIVFWVLLIMQGFFIEIIKYENSSDKLKLLSLDAIPV